MFNEGERAEVKDFFCETNTTDANRYSKYSNLHMPREDLQRATRGASVFTGPQESYCVCENAACNLITFIQ